MTYMNDYSKEIFKDPITLRRKLALFLGTPEKVETYAQACEKFFAKSGGVGIVFGATWSWWGFFMGWLWALYRKQYILALVIFFLNLIPIVGFATMIVCGICAKYLVCKSFVESLNMQNDAFLALNGGRNIWVIWLAVIVCFIILLSVILGLIFMSADEMLRIIFDSKEQGVFVMNAKFYEI